MRSEAMAKLRAENDELRLRLEEAEQALEAIRTGQVDSLVVDGPLGARIYSLDSAIHSYRVLVEAMSEGAAALGDGGAIAYCNGRFGTLVGAPLERVMGTPLREWIPERFRPSVESMLQRAGAADVRQELALAGRDGEEIPVYLSMTALRDEGEKVYCVVVTDLREQKRSEEIVAAERLARSVLDQSAEAIVVCDRSGRVTRASRGAETLCGRGPLFVPFAEAFPLVLAATGGAARSGDVAQAALGGEVLRAASGFLRRADGAPVDVLVSAAAVRGAGGEVVGCVITLVDVTEHRRREEALRRSEERYRIAAESLREADRRKNEFLAVLSHELRNPLAPIHNSLYILDRTAPGGEQERRVKAILHRHVGQLTRLVDDLLDLTRISRNKVQLRPERLEVNELVHRAIEDHRSLFEANGVLLDAQLAPEPIFVLADGPRIGQVIGNLLQNAAKFTARGGRTQVSVERDDAGGRAVLRVADTGVGIAPELIGRLFEPFTQADATLDRRKGGLGLGLALVRSLVELHGGDVSVRSDGVGRGAEFVVRLPLATAGSEAAHPRAGAGRRPRRILVVEDNPDAASSLREALELGGHVVAVAYDGAEGVARAREFRPEVVLCDIGLPGTDGYAFARALRADCAFRGVVLLALSGYARPEDVQRATQAGFDGHLAKPASLERLEAALATAPGDGASRELG
ncbi:MAG TPA: ATP-binding protein [Anaeromyxobacter sp.]